jgi:hypothetical protein
MCLHIIYAPLLVKKFQKRKLNNVFLSLIAVTENALWKHNMGKLNPVFHENCASIKILSNIIFVSVNYVVESTGTNILYIPLCYVAFNCNDLSLLYGIMLYTEASGGVFGGKKMLHLQK